MELTTPSLPNRIDNYRLDQLIATSATACIYRGADVRTGRTVAIKIPHLAIEGDQLFYRRLQREQQIGAKLDHPSIVKFFSDPKRSRAYLVMEWVEARPLRHIMCGMKSLPRERAVGIAVKICDALEYLHAQGVVHRDLKPENILIDDSDNIRLIDFGIASLTGARRLTFGKLSQVMGTPDYISPEQVRGKRGNTRSDIYALGVILYEMLTGVTPFPGDNPFAIMNLRLTAPPIPAREVNPEITPGLEKILCSALERDPNNRCPSARQFSWDLQHQDQLGAEDRMKPACTGPSTLSRLGSVLRYARISLIPVSILALLLYAARHT